MLGIRHCSPYFKLRFNYHSIPYASQLRAKPHKTDPGEHSFIMADGFNPSVESETSSVQKKQKLIHIVSLDYLENTLKTHREHKELHVKMLESTIVPIIPFQPTKIIQHIRLLSTAVTSKVDIISSFQGFLSQVQRTPTTNASAQTKYDSANITTDDDETAEYGGDDNENDCNYFEDNDDDKQTCDAPEFPPPNHIYFATKAGPVATKPTENETIVNADSGQVGEAPKVASQRQVVVSTMTLRPRREKPGVSVEQPPTIVTAPPVGIVTKGANIVRVPSITSPSYLQFYSFEMWRVIKSTTQHKVYFESLHLMSNLSSGGLSMAKMKSGRQNTTWLNALAYCFQHFRTGIVLGEQQTLLQNQYAESVQLFKTKYAYEISHFHRRLKDYLWCDLAVNILSHYSHHHHSNQQHTEEMRTLCTDNVTAQVGYFSDRLNKTIEGMTVSEYEKLKATLSRTIGESEL